MGISSSNRRRNNYFHHPPPPSLHPSSSSYYYSSEYPPGPPLLPPPPPPPPPNSYYYAGGYNSYNYANSSTGRFNSHPHYANQTNWWPAVRPPPLVPLLPPPLPPIEQRQAKKIRNDVNVHKDTLRLEVDQLNSDQHLVSFIFDALYDGSITVLYFAKEEPNCKFVPLYPEAFTPVRIPFQKGPGQKFIQPSGTGIDLGFFALDDLAKPSSEEDIFPLVISAEIRPQNLSTDEYSGERLSDTSPHMQITQAVLEKNNGDSFQVKVIRQLLWIDEVRYELREIFGIGSSSTDNFDDNAQGEECVICMTEPKDTAVLPCRHMCLCSECAKALKLQSNKCPICRQPIEELLEIKINNGDS